MDLNSKASEILDQMLVLDASTDGWQKIKETPHCVLYSKPSTAFKGQVYKSEGVIPAPFPQVFQLLYPGAENPRRPEWDSTVSSTIVEKPAHDTDVIHSKTAPVCMGMISAREFVDLVKVVKADNRIFTAAASIDHPRVPKSKEFVRGFNHPNSISCSAHPENSGHTILVQYVQSDIGGMLPRSVVEGAIGSATADAYPKIKALLTSNLNSAIDLD